MSLHPIGSDSGYSPPLHIELELLGQRFNVIEMGPEFLRLRGAVTAAPGPATVRGDLDGRVTVFHLDLFDGINPQRKRQPCRIQPVTTEPVAQATAAVG